MSHTPTIVTAHADAPRPEPVPLVDLGLQHRQIAQEVSMAIEAVLDKTAFVLGPEVTAFEHEYADFSEVANCVGVGNGTDAIELILRGAGIGPGDDVIIPANTFVATAEAVLRAGAKLVLADCGDDFLLDPAAVASALTPQTRAVVAVDLYGQVPDMRAIQEAAGSDVLLFEDAAQSQGATHFGQRAGSFGIGAATSFYPGKNLGAYGDAGASMTNDDQVADRIRALRNHGGVKRYEHTYVGTNSRLDSVQAAVLRIKLRALPAWNDQRRQAADRYQALLEDLEQVVLPETADGNEHVWHLYVVRVPDRDRVLRELQAAGIGAGIHYPAPIHHLPAFSDLSAETGRHPRAERFAGEILSLPIYPGITAEQQERVAASLRASIKARTSL
ncbi:MAG: DegT/DnrJ/EryC1/StrS family aminotransferase [Microlunatus sp.]